MLYNKEWFIMLRSMISRGCSVSFFGVGRSNISLLSALPLRNCRVTIRSDKKIDRSLLPKGVFIERFFEGERALCDINEDIIFFSPSVRRERAEFQAARERGVIFSSDAELFFEENKAPVFAVTGSDGKSTTATLISLFLRAGGVRSELIGNIGRPMTEALSRGAEAYVCELSSFMLQYISPPSVRACITNITPNHLDWHESLGEYKKTKLAVAKKCDGLVISEENLEISGAYAIACDRSDFKALRKRYDAELYITSEGGYICKNGAPILALESVRRKERHNIKNLMMAIAMTDGYVGYDGIRSVAESFCGLEHRCKTILSLDGVDYIDSSIDSTPARTVATLTSLDRRVVILLGGRGKGLDYRELLPALRKYAAYTVIAGENAEEIYKAVGKEVKVQVLPDFNSAVERGIDLAKEVGALLLSPASTSFDVFKNYAERGKKFKEIVLKWHNMTI